MTERVLEGTWEEMVGRHATELAGHRVRLIILDSNVAPEGRDASPAAEAFTARVGRMHLGATDASERTGEAFTDILAEKHREGHL